ncbi:MAG: hypothetical protein KJ601_07040, partial [Nanoarchaeota archaeon]|nr:hypothetical protein [Nanoarchaeota archaeon]
YKELSEEVQFSVFKEAVLLYSFIEYYFRYLFHVCPKLRNGKLVVTDRYFYDLYGQNNYSEKSLIVPLLLKLFPKPDYTFILDADYDVLTKRDKNVKVMSKVSTRDKVRRVHKIEDLQRQRQRYAKLKGNKINTERSVKTNVQIIIDTTWRSLIR